MWKLGQSIIGEDEDEREGDFFDQQTSEDGLCNLTPTQRMYGFAACLIVGLLFVFLSLIAFMKPIKFALLFTFGNMFAVGSTAFLIGPAEQLRKMFDPIRVYATSIYLGFAILALLCAIWFHSKILTVLAMICEIGALVWYSLSYIPFARRMVSNMMIRLFDTEI